MVYRATIGKGILHEFRNWTLRRMNIATDHASGQWIDFG